MNEWMLFKIPPEFMLFRYSGRDLAPSLGGGRKQFSRTWTTFFPEKFPFSRRKFLTTFPFLSHRPGFSDLTFLYCIKCRIRPFLHQKNHYFKKEFLDIFPLCTFARIRQHYFSKYWGDQCMGRPPHLKFGGTVPPVPLGLRPCLDILLWRF